MIQDDTKKKTKNIALGILDLVENTPRSFVHDVLMKQLLRSGTSIGANYRAACRARSKAEFIAKMGIVEEEADESLYWLELLSERGMAPAETMQSLMRAINEVLALTVASIRTTKRGM
jgi:four helix bundle protein